LKDTVSHNGQEFYRTILPVNAKLLSADTNKAIALALPAEKDRQPDLLYFSAVLVSEGANLNMDFFTQHDLLQARSSAVSKYVAWEHSTAPMGRPRNTDIIGHIDVAVITSQKTGEAIAESEITEEDGILSVPEKYGKIDVTIGGVIYALDFPDQTKLIEGATADQDLGISMECLFPTWSYLVGSERNEFEKDSKEGEALAVKWEERKSEGSEPVFRRLISPIFSGSAMTWNRANPRSAILAAAELQGIRVCKKSGVDENDMKRFNIGCPGKCGACAKENKEGEIDENVTEKENLNQEVDRMDEVKAITKEDLDMAIKVVVAGLKDEDARVQLGTVQAALETITKQRDEAVKSVEGHDTAIADKDTEIEGLKTKLDETEKEYAGFKEETEKDKAVADRMEKLTKAGVALKDKKGEAQKAKVREMDEETFASYLGDLEDVKASAKADDDEEAAEETTEEATEVVPEKVTEEATEETEEAEEAEAETPEADVEEAQASTQAVNTDSTPDKKVSARDAMLQLGHAE